MPILPENKARYPANWKELSWAIRERAGNRCEGCGAENGHPHPVTGARVVLTVAHLDHTPENCAETNLRAWCQKCHNGYDARQRVANRKARTMLRGGQLSLELCPKCQGTKWVSQVWSDDSIHGGPCPECQGTGDAYTKRGIKSLGDRKNSKGGKQHERTP